MKFCKIWESLLGDGWKTDLYTNGEVRDLPSVLYNGHDLLVVFGLPPSLSSIRCQFAFESLVCTT